MRRASVRNADGVDVVPDIARWPEVFDTLRMAAAAKAIGWATWETTLLVLLEEGGWLAEAAERSAA